MGNYGQLGQIRAIGAISGNSGQIGLFEQVEKGVNVNTLSKDGTQRQCYTATAVKKITRRNFRACPKGCRDSFQSGEGSFQAPSLATYASVMEAFVNPALEIFDRARSLGPPPKGNGLYACMKKWRRMLTD